MNPELLYLLKVNLALAIFYTFYWFLLKRETFYEWNRYYFLLTIPLALLFPLINFSDFFSSEQVSTIRQISPHFPINVSGKESGFTLIEGVLLVMVMGTGILLSRLGIQLVSLWEIRSKSVPSVSDKDYRIRNLQIVANPFSFFRTIYINPGLHNEEDMQTILKHEQIHVRQRHSFDILLFELVGALCWYNPFVWLIKQAVRQNIEFFTDKHVLKTGYDRRHYQHELLKVSQIPSFLGIANNFNFNHLKQRITMMNKKQSSRAKLIKFALIIPVFTGASLISNAQNVVDTKDNNITVSVKTTGVVVHVDKDVHDFGTIKETNGNVSAVFTITNNSGEPVVIEDVKASCGCTTPEWTKEPIAAGKQGHVKATFSPAGRPGPFDKTITVKIKGNASPLILRIKGTVDQK